MFRAVPYAILALFALLTITPGAVAQTTASDLASRYEREGWKTDFSKREVDLAEVRSGGPPKDGIPSIDDPRFAPVANETGLADREPVIPVVIGDEARAYPVRILMFHEIVNDVFAGRPIAVTYCPLCNSAIVFDRRLDGQLLDFGTTGKLRKSDLVMYDRQTESWWQQFTGRALVGELAGSTLEMIPTGLVSWADFKTRHPNGRVLQPPSDVSRRYGQNPYVRYDGGARPFLYDGSLPEGIEPMERVVIVRDRTGKPTMAIAMNALRQAGELARDGYRITWSQGQASALDTAQIKDGRDVGSVKVTDGAGKPALHEVTFAFVVHAFYPEIKIGT